MIKKQDLEVILDSIQTLVNANFNTKLTSITTEKGDNLLLQPLDSRGFAILGLTETIMNYDPFIAILVENLENISIPGGSASKATFYVVAVKEDNGVDVAIHKKMLRYQRAIQEIFIENFDDLGTGTKYEIAGLAPQRLQGLNTSKTFRGAGVVVSFPFTS